MADQDSHTPLGQFVKPLKQFRFCLGIHRTGWLIENQDLRIAEHCSGQCYLLPFADAQFMSTIEQLAEQ